MADLDLSSVAVGDVVAITVLNGSSRVTRVEKVTKTHIIADGRKFQRSGGSQVHCSGWNKPTLDNRPEVIDRVRRQALRSEIAHMAGKIPESAPLDALMRLHQEILALCGEGGAITPPA